jgi:hypothetical protein
MRKTIPRSASPEPPLSGEAQLRNFHGQRALRITRCLKIFSTYIDAAGSLKEAHSIQCLKVHFRVTALHFATHCLHSSQRNDDAQLGIGMKALETKTNSRAIEV